MYSIERVPRWIRWQALAALAGLALCARPAGAGLILDQQNVVPTEIGFVAEALGQVVSPGTLVHNQLAQTFTVGVSGTLSRVGLQILKEEAAKPLTVSIFGTVGGLPAPSDLLATLDVPASVFPPLSGSIPIPMTDFDLGAASLPVSIGEVLAIAISTPASTAPPDSIFQYEMILTGESTYAGGAAYRRAPISGPFSMGFGDDFDWGFQTFVDDGVTATPEPSSLILLSLGSVSVVGWRWRTRPAK
jgi:hypothetical protein